MYKQYLSFFTVDPCESDPLGVGTPCMNGGQCTGFSAQEDVSVAYFICTCPPGFTGVRCEGDTIIDQVRTSVIYWDLGSWI